MLRIVSHWGGKWSLRLGVTTIVVLVLMLAISNAGSTRSTALAQGEEGTAQPGEGQAPAGTVVEAEFTDQPPALTKAERRALRRSLNESEGTGPEVGNQVPVEAPAGDGVPEAALRTNAPEAASTFKIFRDSIIPVAAIGGKLSNAAPFQEPSTGANGKNVFHTANWYAARSTDNGSTWTFVNPFKIFGKHPVDKIGFCCDQVTLYDPIHNRQWWLLQYGTGVAGQGGLKIANATGSGFKSWCYYNLDARWFGFANAGDAGLDYNDVAVTKNYLYISTNIFPPGQVGFGGILRLPIDPMLTCGNLSYSYYTAAKHFTFKLVQGAHTTMYWASNWAEPGGWTCGGCANGNAVRVYSWPEKSAISYADRSIDPFVFYKRASGQNCASQSGVVKNWCEFWDSRVAGGALSEGVLHFSFNARQTTNRPFPYTHWVRFRESDKAYLGYWDLYATWGAFLYLSLSPNNDGAIGGNFAYGGGTGATNYYPGGALLILDDYTTDVGNTWSLGLNFFLPGEGNTCKYTSGLGPLYRWGDYLTVRPYYPAGYAFVAGNWAYKGGNCGSAGAFSEPHNVIFGRGRDKPEYDRWKKN